VGFGESWSGEAQRGAAWRGDLLDILVQLTRAFNDKGETMGEPPKDFWSLSPEEEAWMEARNKAMVEVLQSFAIPPAEIGQKVANSHPAQKDPWLKRIALIMD